jgi:hypothetical protein
MTKEERDALRRLVEATKKVAVQEKTAAIIEQAEAQQRQEEQEE